MNKLRLVLMLFCGMFMLLGCRHEWEEPEFKLEDWDASGVQPTQFWTINHRFVKGIHTNGEAPDSLVPVKKYGTLPRYIRAVVVSSDEGGNYYKSMVIQDATGGIELELDASGLYNTYPVGQRIVLICNGLVIGDYNNLPQIGWIYNENQVGRVNPLFIDKYIIRDGMPSAKYIPKPLTNNEIDFLSHDDINKLVRLEGVTFEDKAINQPFAYNDFTTDWIVNVPLANGIQEVTVRTSNFAKFRSMIIQKKEYNLTGILTIYRNTYQLMIRTKDDIEPPKPSGALEFDFTENPLTEGWSNQTVAGNSKWTHRPGSQSMMHLGNNQNTMEDWLISPVIDYPDFANGYLIFEHQLPVLNGQYDAYQVYYTTSTSANFNISDWKLWGTPNTSAQFGWSNRFPLSTINANKFRIAFRYNASNPDIETYTWSIKKVEIRNK